MADSNRKYPEISFVDTNTDTLVNNMIQAYEAFTNRTLYPADPARLFILWIADIIIQERVIINESAKQNVPRYAENEYLDSLAEIFKDTERLQPQPARTTIRFYLSVTRPTVQTIPSGTRVTVDGEIIFATQADLNIAAGDLYGDAIAVCTTTEIDPVTGEEQSIGTKGNGFIPGQISQVIDLYPFYEQAENITTSEGGADKETDDAFYDRMRQSMEAFSTAGPRGAYIYWTKTASSRITDVKPSSPSPGVADIRVLLENGELPGEEMINLIMETLSGDKVPLTDYVTVSAPDTVPFDIDVTFYIPKPRENSAAVITADVEKAVAAYIKWQTEAMGRDINPDELIYLIKKAGAKRVEVRQPEFTFIDEHEVAALQQQDVINGGVEDE